MNLQDVVFEELIDALMMDEPTPSYEALVRWSDRYPQFRDELMEFFAEWGVQSELDIEAEVDEERLSNLAVSHALDLLHRRGETNRKVHSASAAPRLLKTAAGIGISCEALARSVGLDVMILRKLDLRRITQIPQRCVEALASELRLVAQQVQEMIIGTPLLAANVRHKSNRKPVATTETFENAVRGSTLSEAEKELWLQAVKAENNRSEG